MIRERTLLEHAQSLTDAQDEAAAAAHSEQPRVVALDKAATALGAEAPDCLHALGYVARRLPALKDAVDDAGAVARMVKGLLDVYGGETDTLRALVAEGYTVSGCARTLGATAAASR